jgi:hemoglobin
MDSELRPRSATASPLDGAALSSVNEESIRRLVHGFYDAVRRDDVIGPIFLRQIAPERWPHHLDKMCAFWSSVLLRTHRYDGRPLPPHLRLPDLSDAHFARWLGLFRVTAREVFNGEDAARIIALAERIAHSFRLAVAFHRGEDTTRVRPLPASADASDRSAQA